MPPNHAPPFRPRVHRSHLLKSLFWFSLPLLAAGAFWLAAVGRDPSVHPAPISPASELVSGLVVSSASPALGAARCGPSDTASSTVPVDARCGAEELYWRSFAFEGQSLWMRLHRGDDPGYLLVTVDGAPASHLNPYTGRHALPAPDAGYLPLFSPYEQPHRRPSSEWLLVHEAAAPGRHAVVLALLTEADGQSATDIFSALAVDPPLQPGRPFWPGVMLILLAMLLAAPTVLAIGTWPSALVAAVKVPIALRRALNRAMFPSPALLGAGTLLLLALIGAGVATDSFQLSLPGVMGLALIGLKRPAFWFGSLLFGLPAYLHPIPLLPGFALNLVEIGVWGGLALVAARAWVSEPRAGMSQSRGVMRGVTISLLCLTAVALIASVDAQFRAEALREWRTVYLAGFLFLIALIALLRHSAHLAEDVAILVTMWIGGAVAISLFGYYAYVQGVSVTDVEGVRRIRGLYGSPNNLALYLERTVLVSLALSLYSTSTPRRVLWLALLILQSGALLLTFSKGALLLGLPAGWLCLLLVNRHFRHAWPDSRPATRILLGAAGIGLLALLPFLGTPRFAGLLNWQESFPNLVRTHLWRSGLEMFRDHWLGGVGPDNFLYLYRGEYIVPAVWNEPSLNHPHNLFLDLMTRLGLPGLVCGLLFLASGVAFLWRHIAAQPPNRVALGCLAACTAGVAHGMVDVSHALPDLMLVWALLFGLWCVADDDLATRRLLS